MDGVLNIVTILLSNILFATLATCIAKKDIAVTIPLRPDSTNSDKEFDRIFGAGTRRMIQDTMHKMNGIVILSVVTAYAILTFLSTDWQHGVMVWFNSMAVYSLLFDINCARGMGKPWYFLGTTAATDTMIKNGKTKAYACVACIVVVHVLYFVL